MAITMPIDWVPLLDDALLVVTLAVIVLFQRVYGRAYLRRHGLRIRGVTITRIDGEAPAR